MLMMMVLEFQKMNIENVIKPFYRIDKSRGQNKSGVGLGLSIANDIIRSHGGNISLDKSPLNGLKLRFLYLFNFFFFFYFYST